MFFHKTTFSVKKIKLQEIEVINHSSFDMLGKSCQLDTKNAIKNRLKALQIKLSMLDPLRKFALEHPESILKKVIKHEDKWTLKPNTRKFIEVKKTIVKPEVKDEKIIQPLSIQTIHRPRPTERIVKPVRTGTSQSLNSELILNTDQNENGANQFKAYDYQNAGHLFNKKAANRNVRKTWDPNQLGDEPQFKKQKGKANNRRDHGKKSSSFENSSSYSGKGGRGGRGRGRGGARSSGMGRINWPKEG